MTATVTDLDTPLIRIQRAVEAAGGGAIVNLLPAGTPCTHYIDAVNAQQAATIAADLLLNVQVSMLRITGAQILVRLT